MDAAELRRGRIAAGLTAFGIAWCAAMIVVGFTVPVMSSGETAIGYEGLSVLPWLAAPTALSLGVWLALRAACTSGRAGSLVLADALVFVLWLFVFVSGFSIGLAYVPAAVALLAAVTVMPERAGARAVRCGRAA